MKKLFLTLILLLAGVGQSNQADASGSNTVFLPVRYSDYNFTPALQDEDFNSSMLFNLLESTNESIWVSRVTPFLYRQTYYYTALGYTVGLEFANFETINFRYYSNLNAILGLSSGNEIVVLLPPLARGASKQKDPR